MNPHDYWKNPPIENSPAKYLTTPNGHKRSRYLVSLFEEFEISKESSILEIGCNVGRNLNHLWKAGYQNLTGFDINREALELLRDSFPDMKVSLFLGEAGDIMPEMEKVNVIFTMAVLCHIPPGEAEIVFENMARLTSRIITLEDEVTRKTKRHFARNYKRVFENLGFKEIFHKDNPPGLNQSYVARIFLKE